MGKVLVAYFGGSGFGKTAAELKGSVSEDTVIVEGKLLNGGTSVEELEKWVKNCGFCS